jgi:hypothetical protein
MNWLKNKLINKSEVARQIGISSILFRMKLKISIEIDLRVMNLKNLTKYERCFIIVYTFVSKSAFSIHNFKSCLQNIKIYT